MNNPDYQSNQQYLIRKLRYRLQRQGMLELDAWLAPLLSATTSRDTAVLQALAYLADCETPELLAMQSGKKPVPKELIPWLNP